MATGSISVEVRRAVMNGFAGHLEALVDFNETAAALEATVTYAYDFGPPVTARVYSGRSRGETPPAAMRASRNVRNEKATFEVNVLVQMLGGDVEEADQRAQDIGVVFEDWLGDLKSNELDVDGLNSVKVTGWTADYMAVDGGMASARTYTVEYTARLD